MKENTPRMKRGWRPGRRCRRAHCVYAPGTHCRAPEPRAAGGCRGRRAAGGPSPSGAHRSGCLWRPWPTGRTGGSRTRSSRGRADPSCGCSRRCERRRARCSGRPAHTAPTPVESKSKVTLLINCDDKNKLADCSENCNSACSSDKNIFFPTN